MNSNWETEIISIIAAKPYLNLSLAIGSVCQNTTG